MNGRLLRLLAAALVASALGACDDSPSPPGPPDGGTGPLAIDVLDPPGSQIGLHYGKSVALRVRYRTADAAKTPVAGAQMEFSIFGDPAGSTLSAAAALTDDDGVATLSLTAGAAETSFRVAASANNATDANFSVSVSNRGFVELDVQLEWSALPAGGTLRAMLYAAGACSVLSPAPTPPTPFRSLTETGDTTTTLRFINLLSASFAVVGRAEDAGGHLIAAGCVDVAAPLLPPGAGVSLPVPLVAVVPSAVGAFELSTSLMVTTPTLASQPWHKLADCADGLGQAVLDATVAALPADLASAVAQKRGAENTSGCRPATIAATDSLDAQLQALLMITGAPGTQLPGMVADLDTLSASAQLTSRLTISAAGPSVLAAEHALERIDLGQAGTGAAASFDPLAVALPIIDVTDVPITFDGVKLEIGEHGFTLRLPFLWHSAFESVVVGSRFVTLAPPTTRGFVGLAVQAATRTSLVGCAAVEDLVCKTTGAANCTGLVATACTAGLDALAATLDAGFAAPAGLDTVWSGTCQAVDSNADLVIDRLDSGVWTTSAVASAIFTGLRP